MKTKSTKPHNLIKHLDISFWALGHLTHRSFHTPEFSSLSSTAQRKRGRGTDCSSCSWGNFHICEELCSFWVCEMSPDRSLLQLQVHSKPEGLKQKMGTPQDRPHSLWTPTGSSTEENTSTHWVLRFPALGTGGRGLDSGTKNHTSIMILDLSSGLPQFL